MSIKRITIYGWVVPYDRYRGKGSGSLVDLVYFVEVPEDVSNNDIMLDIFSLIESNGYFINPKHIAGRNTPVERDKVVVEDWDQYVSVGVENNPPMPEGAF